MAMNNRLSAMFAAGVALLIASLPIHAHHGTATFDMEHLVTVKGTVAGFEWTNPHAYIYLEVKDEKGTVEKWAAECGSTPMMARFGWKRDSVKKGDQITAVGHPAKDGAKFMRLEKVVFADGRELLGSALIPAGAGTN
jgi:hypothetical protein